MPLEICEDSKQNEINLTIKKAVQINVPPLNF